MSIVKVGFSYHKGKVFSNLIRWVTDSEISHVYVRLPTSIGKDIIFQASGMEVNLCGVDLFIKNGGVIVEEYDVEVSEKVYAATKSFIIDNLGKPYSMLEVFGFLFVILIKKFGRWINNPFAQGDKAYICVQLVMDYVGMESNSERWSPEDFRRWCKDNAKKVS